MRRLRILDSARADIAEIFAYIERQSADTAIAKSFARALNDQCRRLASLPGTLGRARPELRHDLRSAPFKGYVIFFRYIDNVLEVVRIIQGHRDIASLFAERDDE